MAAEPAPRGELPRRGLARGLRLRGRRLEMGPSRAGEKTRCRRAGGERCLWGGDGDGVLARLRLDIGDTGREGIDCGRGEAKVRWTALRASHASQRTGPRNGWVVAKRTERGRAKRVWIMIGGWLSGLPLGLRVEAMGRCAPAASDRPTRAQCWVGWRKVSSTRQTVWEPKWDHRLPPSVLAERSAGRGGCPKDGGQVT